MADTERDVWEIQKLADWLADHKTADDLAGHLEDIIKARNTLNRVIGRAREVRHAA